MKPLCNAKPVSGVWASKRQPAARGVPAAPPLDARTLGPVRFTSAPGLSAAGGLGGSQHHQLQRRRWPVTERDPVRVHTQPVAVGLGVALRCCSLNPELGGQRPRLREPPVRHEPKARGSQEDCREVGCCGGRVQGCLLQSGRVRGHRRARQPGASGSFYQDTNSCSRADGEKGDPRDRRLLHLTSHIAELRGKGLLPRCPLPTVRSTRTPGVGTRCTRPAGRRRPPGPRRPGPWKECAGARKDGGRSGRRKQRGKDLGSSSATRWGRRTPQSSRSRAAGLPGSRSAGGLRGRGRGGYWPRLRSCRSRV
ncbi:uncharacterized protein LOC115278317 [Suricata suricatta]|uniref:uncharacterized protein LOC115278317 n=1 Tax=Suricata suricatta TaxID=37032 RepID=UPI001156939E|nr:uncharacterized protein LOC115278317 [Suricata suricatta]